MKINSLFSLLLLSLAAPAFAEDALSFKSPDQRIAFNIHIDNSQLTCDARMGEVAILKPSPLILTLDGNSLTHEIQMHEATTELMRHTYPWRGLKSSVNHESRLIKIPITQPKTKNGFSLEVQIFNDGVGFRFIIPADQHKQSRTPDETTTFNLPPASIVWYHGLGGHYEAVHTKKPIEEIPAEEWLAPPVTLKLPNNAGYASITESSLINYAGMALQSDGKNGLVIGLGHKQPLNYPFKLRYGEEEHKRLSTPAAIKETIITPWRIILIAPDLNTLINSDIISSLAPPPDAALFPKGIHTEWIRPGRAVWKFLDGGESTYEEMRAFSGMAGQLGFEHHVIEGFWRRWSEEQLRELVVFSKDHNVGIWLWVHSNRLRTPQARAEFWKKCNDAGVVGAKVDFFDHEAREVVDLYQTLLREAAQHKLMLNFHGANKPAGEARTWPNELTREGIRGMESRMAERARHDATLPFTRFLAGHGDYTPVVFGPRRGDTSWTHQIATAAIFNSPLLIYGGNPRTLLANPAVEMIKAIPATWDQTIALPISEIGELAAFAKRDGETWFLAILNGPSPKTIQVPLTFLKADEYRALIVKDDKDNPAAVELENKMIRSGDKLDLQLPAGGGYIARFTVP